MTDVKTPGKMSTMPTPVSNFRIPADVKERAVAHAQSEGKSLSEVVIDLLREYGDELFEREVRRFPFNGHPRDGYAIRATNAGRHSWTAVNERYQWGSYTEFATEVDALEAAARDAAARCHAEAQESIQRVIRKLTDTESN